MDDLPANRQSRLPLPPDQEMFIHIMPASSYALGVFSLNFTPGNPPRLEYHWRFTHLQDIQQGSMLMILSPQQFARFLNFPDPIDARMARVEGEKAQLQQENTQLQGELARLRNARISLGKFHSEVNLTSNLRDSLNRAYDDLDTARADRNDTCNRLVAFVTNAQKKDQMQEKLLKIQADIITKLEEENRALSAGDITAEER